MTGNQVLYNSRAKTSVRVSIIETCVMNKYDSFPQQIPYEDECPFTPRAIFDPVRVLPLARVNGKCSKKEIVRETRQSAVEPGHNEFPKEQWKLQTNARNKINVHGCNKKSICSGTRAGEVAGKQCRLMAGKIGFLCLIYHSLRSLRFKLNISGVHVGAGRQLLILARTTVVCGSH